MLSKQTDIKHKVLHKLGLAHEEILIYLYLCDNQQSTALKISKENKLGRTKVYRILDKLYKLGLTDQIVGPRGFLFEPKPFENINQLLAEKELEVVDLRNSVPVLINDLKKLSKKFKESKDYKILYYEGIEGLKQVTWNSTKGVNPLYLYEIADMNAFLEKPFAEKVRREIMKNGRITKQLTNTKKIKSFSNIREYIKSYWEVRYVDPKIFNIEVEILVYNNVIALYHTNVEEPFCVEIYNNKLAAMQKQLFEFMWKKAKKMKLTSPGGASQLV